MERILRSGAGSWRRLRNFTKSYWLETATAFREVGWNTLLLDYRGYGRSQGRPGENGTYLDARAAWMHLVRERGIDPFDVVAAAVPLPGIRRFVRLGYPSLSRMPRLDLPLLVVHGRGDNLVPIEHGRALFEVAPGQKRFVELRGGHNDAFTVSRGEYVAALAEFERGLTEN